MPGRRGWAPPPNALVVLLVLLSGCTIGPDTGPDPEVDAAAYPALTTVPPRPRLSYSIDQRREIADALVSDRANARYDRAVARYEVGLDYIPPPAEPPRVVAEPEPPVGGVEARPVTPPEPLPSGGGEIADLAVRQQVLTERNNGRLATFLTILERQLQLNQQAEAAGIRVPPDAVQPETLPGRPPAAPVDAEPAAAPEQPAVTTPTPAERVSALDTFSSFLGGIFDTEGAPPAVDSPADDLPAAAEPHGSSEADPLSVAFQPRSATPPAEAEPALRAAAQAALADTRRLVVEGRGASPALSLDRARSVASWLMRLGAPADMVSFKGGGAGDNVIVRLLPADSA